MASSIRIVRFNLLRCLKRIVIFQSFLLQTVPSFCVNLSCSFVGAVLCAL